MLRKTGYFNEVEMDVDKQYNMLLITAYVGYGYVFSVYFSGKDCALLEKNTLIPLCFIIFLTLKFSNLPTALETK